MGEDEKQRGALWKRWPLWKCKQLQFPFSSIHRCKTPTEYLKQEPALYPVGTRAIVISSVNKVYEYIADFFLYMAQVAKPAAEEACYFSMVCRFSTSHINQYKRI